MPGSGRVAALASTHPWRLRKRPIVMSLKPRRDAIRVFAMPFDFNFRIARSIEGFTLWAPFCPRLKRRSSAVPPRSMRRLYTATVLRLLSKARAKSVALASPAMAREAMAKASACLSL
jgi:hypothetical protein